MLEPNRVELPTAQTTNGNGASPEPPAGPTLVPKPEYRWYHKVAGVAAAVFCFELGVFLLLFPWTHYWDVSYGLFLPTWIRPIWANPYFRGAISGVGILNVYISLSEVFRLRRFSS